MLLKSWYVPSYIELPEDLGMCGRR